jgi:hypothetical protein
MPISIPGMTLTWGTCVWYINWPDRCAYRTLSRVLIKGTVTFASAVGLHSFLESKIVTVTLGAQDAFVHDVYFFHDIYYIVK